MYSVRYHTARMPLQTYIEEYRDSEKFMVFCQACKQYNACWSCPPYDFDTGEYLAPYGFAYVIGAQIVPDEVIRRVCTNAQQIRTLGRQIISEVRTSFDVHLLELESSCPGSRAFFAGMCRFCPEGECSRIKKQPCIYPAKVRPSLESFGFDVEKTASVLLHTPLKWSTDGKLPDYFMLVAGFFTASEVNPVTPLARRMLNTGE